MYGFDKLSAIYNLHRTPEKILHILALLGGCFGALLGMIVFRHKKNKVHFIITLLIACITHGYILFTYTNFIPLITTGGSGNIGL